MPTRPRFVFAIATTIMLGAIATVGRAALEPASIRSPKPQGWVVDQAGLLNPTELAALNVLGDEVNRRDGAELAVVTVRTLGGGDHRGFATRLFNLWGIGDRHRNNGLLLFVAIDDRSAEIILGDGIDSDAEVAQSDRIMQQVIVPRFRRGDNAGAIMEGARACAVAFLGVVDDRTPPAAPPALELEDSVPRPSTLPRPARSVRPPASDVLTLVLALFGLPVVGIAGWVGFRAIGRSRPRRCTGCSMTMTKLDEAADDAYLEPAERTEERVGSVDYDVWLCPGCGQVEKLRFGRWFTRYSRCPECGAVTTGKTTKTLRAATTLSGGLLEIHEHCAHCNRENTYTRSTPRVSSASSSSCRSSSGSGGGRSSGRGSSGRW